MTASTAFPTTGTWPSMTWRRFVTVLLAAVAFAAPAFSVGRATAHDSAAPVKIVRVMEPTSTEWGYGMCAHGVPCA